MGFWDIMRLVGAVFVVVIMLVFTYYGSRWYAKRMGLAPGQGAGKYIRVVERAVLAQGSAVCVVKIGEVYYLLGVGDKQVTMLGTLDGFVESEASARDPGVPFSRLLSGLIAKKDPGNNTSDDGGDR
jgi:flagellar protein FliO/FliZ